jgi:hypothetical protein
MTINTTPIRTLLALLAVAVVATGCVTAKPTETEAGTATAAAPAPATSTATAIVSAPAKPDDWCDRYPDSFVCQEKTSDSGDWCTRHPDSFVCHEKTTDSGDWCTRHPDSFVCHEKTTDSGDWCTRHPDSFVCQPAAPVPSISAYVVQGGDHLWGISSQPKVYGDPYQWPLLFKRNRADIGDADLIYPGQLIQIERDLTDFQIQEAIDHARTRGAWSLGVTEATDLKYLEATQASSASAATADDAAQMIAQASADLDAAKGVGGVWRLIDSATGGKAVSISKLLQAAKAKLEAGDASEAYRMANRVSEAAQMGVAQVAEQVDAGPVYN